MFKEVSDTVVMMKQKAMEAMLPNELSTKMKEKFLEYAKRMSPAEIEEVGRRFQEARKKAREEWKRKKEQEQAN